MELIIDILSVVLGGALGAMFRYMLASRFDKKNADTFPVGTFSANMLASLFLGAGMGLVYRGIMPMWFIAIYQTGFCATLSTFSSLSWQIAEMLRKKRIFWACVYANATFICGIAIFLSAYAITTFK